MTNHQTQFDLAFQNEARIGLSVLALLMGIFLVVAYGKYSGWFQPSPVTFTAVVDQETGIETLQPFSPFTSVVTRDDRSAPAPSITADNVASESSPVDYQTTWVRPGNNLVPSTSGSATVATHDPNIQGLMPELKTTSSQLTNSQPRSSHFTANDSSTAFQPVVPQPERLAPDEIMESAHTDSNNFNTVLSPPLSPSINAIQEPSGLTTKFVSAEMDSPDGNSVSAFDATSGDSPRRASGLAELPSLRLPAETDDNSPNEIVSSSVEAVTFNQPQPDQKHVQSGGRDISPESTLQDYQVLPDDLPETQSDEQATSIVSQDGDSFWLIAQRVYGDGRLFNALFEFNRTQVKSFNEIPVGTRIATPTLAELQKKWPHLFPRDSMFAVNSTDKSNIYTTVAGDTLFDIARDQLGQASRYLEVHQLNSDRLPADVGHATPLPAGVQMTLPVQR